MPHVGKSIDSLIIYVIVVSVDRNLVLNDGPTRHLALFSLPLFFMGSMQHIP